MKRLVAIVMLSEHRRARREIRRTLPHRAQEDRGIASTSHSYDTPTLGAAPPPPLMFMAFIPVAHDALLGATSISAGLMRVTRAEPLAAVDGYVRLAVSSLAVR